MNNQDKPSAKSILITIPGTPVAKGRPKFATRGKFVTAYTPKATKDAENVISMEAKKQGVTAFSGPVELWIDFYMPIPKSVSKRERERLNNGPHIKRPDADNLAKLVLDALNGIAWEDDNQVFKLSIEKLYSDNPRTEIFIKEWRE